MIKYDNEFYIGDVVFYIKDDKIHEDKVYAISLIFKATKLSGEKFEIKYTLSDNSYFWEYNLFHTAEDLFKRLVENTEVCYAVHER